MNSLTAPLPHQIRPSQAVRDWLDPRGRHMSQRSDVAVRQEVVNRLSRQLGVPNIEEQVSHWLDVWANGRTTPPSGPRTPEIVALQLEAHSVFGGVISHMEEDIERRDVDAIRKREGSFLRALLQVMYAQSQHEMRERGIDSITLWRGEKDILNPNQEGNFDVTPIPFQPLSSFTHQLGQAFNFAGEDYGAIILVSAPASRILATPATGFGVLQQKEEVLFAVSRDGIINDEGFVAQWEDWGFWQQISTWNESHWEIVLETYYRKQEEGEENG